MKTLGYRMYCRRCKKLVQVYECHKEERVLPELKPEFDLITWCCSTCNEPIIEVTDAGQEVKPRPSCAHVVNKRKKERLFSMERCFYS